MKPFRPIISAENIITLLLLFIVSFATFKFQRQVYDAGFEQGYHQGMKKAANERFIIVTDTNIYFKITPK